MKNIVVFKEPKLKPLPLAAQEAMKDAPLLLRLQAAKTAIEACFDLSELLKWKDQAVAIAAAAKAARMPDIARGANRICKEALLRLGQLLFTYNGTVGYYKDGRHGSIKSERSKVAKAFGLSPSVVNTSLRLAAAPKAAVDAVLNDDRIPPNPVSVAKRLPARRQSAVSKRSAGYVMVMSGIDEFGRHKNTGLTTTFRAVETIEVAAVRSLAPDEKKLVRAKITEIIELLDALEEACK